MAVTAEELPSLEMERVREHKCPQDAGKQQGTEPPPTTSREDAAMPKHQFQPIETMLRLHTSRTVMEQTYVVLSGNLLQQL